MSKTVFSSKVGIIGSIWFFYKEQAQTHDTWRDFFEWADIALPMCYLSWMNLVDIKPESMHYVDETWDMLCEMISVDPDAEYVDLAEFFDASPNDIVPSDEG